VVGTDGADGPRSRVAWVAYFDHHWARHVDKSRRGVILRDDGDGELEIAPGLSSRPAHDYYVEIPLVDADTGFSTRTFIDLDDSAVVHETDVELVERLPAIYWRQIIRKMIEYGDVED
jgi:hypothetical protein